VIINSFCNTKEKVHSRDIEEDAFKKEDPIFIIPRKNQIEIMEKHYNSKYFQLIQPPGSGKSVTISYVMLKKLMDNPNLKLIITVPQTFISKSFGRMVFDYNGLKIEWDCTHNLCESVTFSKIKYLIKFLKNKDILTDIRSRIALTTHMSFARAVEKIEDLNTIFNDVIVIFDEAHHVMYDDNGTSNKIGAFIKHVFDNKLNTGIWLATATPYRSDNNNMIPKEIINQFDKHFLPLDEHWEKNIKHIESFSFNFVIYKQNEILNEVKEVFKLGKKKSIIFCPYVGHLMNGIDKHIFKTNLINTIKEVWPECKILDLIEINGRNARKEVLKDNKVSKHVDVILTLRIFDEGSDWVHAEQCIDLSPSNYLRIMYQRFGRLWRDYIGKNIIKYFCFLPFEAKFKNEDERRLHLSKSFNALAASLLLQDIIQPIKYPTTLKGKHTKINPFHEAIPNEDERTEILEKVIKKLIVMKSVSENPSSQDVKQWIKCALTAENIVENQDEVANYIGLIFRRMCNQTHPKKPDWANAFDINKLIEGGFDKIWADDIFENLRVFGTNICTAETFKEFREIINGERQNIEYWKEFAREQADPITGELPPISSFPQGFINMFYKYPDEFSKFKFKILRNDLEHWKEFAREQADPITGELPPISSFPQGFINMFYKYPDEFSKFKFKILRNDLEHWKEFAREQADPITGELPPISSFPQGFINMFYKYPDEFSKFKFKILRNDLEHWKEFAREQADPITGELPPITSFPKAFQAMFYRYSEEFAKFKFKNGKFKEYRRSKNANQSNI